MAEITALHDISELHDITVLHNPKCSTSRHALTVLEEAGVEAGVVLYLKEPLGEAALRDLIAILDDEPDALVRRDSHFAKLGLTEDDVATVDQVVALLVEHPRLLERPVLIRSGRAIIGRPKDRVGPFIAG